MGLVGRNPYLSGAQKLVQARVYAQGLTLAVLVATAAFEVGDASKGKGRWETVKILDPNDPEHKHIIEKRIHREAYAGEDLWRGMSSSPSPIYRPCPVFPLTPHPSLCQKHTDRKPADMVAAEERKIDARKRASKDATSSNRTPSSKGKEAKDKSVPEHKAAGKPERPNAADQEANNQQTPNEKPRIRREGRGKKR